VKQRNVSLLTHGVDGAAPLRRDGNVSAIRLRGEEPVRYLPLDLIDPSPWQRRIFFDQRELRTMAESFGADGSGLVQPPLVRPKGNRYELVAGERRVRAARLAGLAELPFIVRPLTDVQARLARAIENLEREDELAWETAQSYADLLEVARELRANAGAGTVARLAGKEGGRSVVSEYLRVAAELPTEVMREVGALDDDVLPGLSLKSLYSVAQLPRKRRRAALKKLVTGIRRSATVVTSRHSADGDSLPRDGGEGGSPRPPRRVAARRRRNEPRTYAEVMHIGGLQKTIRPPIGNLPANDAASHLNDLAPIVAALGGRLLNTGPVVHRVEVAEAPFELWLVPSPAGVAAATHERLVASVGLLNQLKVSIEEMISRAP
jgi:ParB/RepB/Spo0J family partition protein